MRFSKQSHRRQKGALPLHLLLINNSGKKNINQQIGKTPHHSIIWVRNLAEFQLKLKFNCTFFPTTTYFIRRLLFPATNTYHSVMKRRKIFLLRSEFVFSTFKSFENFVKSKFKCVRYYFSREIALKYIPNTNYHHQAFMRVIGLQQLLGVVVIVT